MTDLTTLKTTQAAAFAAWKACPDKRRAEKARLAAELDAATKAVAAAKKAAEPIATVVVDSGAQVRAWNARREAIAAARAKVARLYGVLEGAWDDQCQAHYLAGTDEEYSRATARAKAAEAELAALEAS